MEETSVTLAFLHCYKLTTVIWDGILYNNKQKAERVFYVAYVSAR